MSSGKVACGDTSATALEFGLVSAGPIGWPETFGPVLFPVCSRIYSVTAELTVVTAISIFPFP